MLVETVAKGGNLLLNVGPERRRHDARDPGAGAARVGRVGARPRRRDPRLDARSTFRATAGTGTRAPATSCTRSTSRRSPEPCFAGLAGRDERDDARRRRAPVPGDRRGRWSSTPAPSTVTRSARATLPVGVCARDAPRRSGCASRPAPRATIADALAGAAAGRRRRGRPAGRYDDESVPDRRARGRDAARRRAAARGS